MPDPGSSHSNDDTWSLAEGREEGRRLLFRVRDQTPPGIQPKDYPILLNIYWRFQDSDNDGMPSSPTLARMRELEETSDELEPAGHGFLTLSITGNQRKEWIWYIRDQGQFMIEVNRVLAGHNPFPIEFQTQLDSEWLSHKSLIDRINESRKP